MFNKLNKLVKDSKAQVEALQSVSSRILDIFDIHKEATEIVAANGIDHIIATIDDELTLAIGCPADKPYAGLHDVTDNNSVTQTILLNTKMVEMFDNDQKLLKATVLHELGHVATTPKDYKPGFLYRLQTTFGFGEGIRVELLADEWAVQHGADIRHMLKTIDPEMSRGTKVRLDNLDKLEL